MKIPKQPITLIIIAFILAAGIIRWETIGSVSPCIKTAGCEHTNMRGKLTTQQWGFPATYREVSRFEPADGGVYAETSVDAKKTNVALIAVNVVFWYALLLMVVNFWRQLLARRKG